MTTSIILIPCLKFLVNLALVCATIVGALYILLIGYSIVASIIFSVFYIPEDHNDGEN
ncbi:MAG: hypothetical protein ACI4XM_08985 [Candidatus Coprovivens sp.]